MNKPDPLESLEADRDGATLQPNSGRGRFSKGDALLDDFMVDYKHFTNGFTVNVSNLGKLDTDAQKAGGYDGVFKLIIDNKIRRWVVPEYVLPRYIRYKNMIDSLANTHPELHKELHEQIR